MWFSCRWDGGFFDQESTTDLDTPDRRGWRPQRPAAIILDATDKNDNRWHATEGSLAHRPDLDLFPLRVLVVAYEPRPRAMEVAVCQY